MRTEPWLFVFALTALGCSGGPGEPTSTSTSAESSPTTVLEDCREPGGRPGLTVMQQNVYIGFDIAPILDAPTPQDVPLRVAAAWVQMVTNDFPSRARALAREIDHAKPALVGIEEVAQFHRFPHDGGAATVVDYLTLLEDALAARGLHYSAVAVQGESDITAPMFVGLDAEGQPLLDIVEMLDREVILARDDVATSGATGANYTAKLPVSIGGQDLSIVRGWTSVVAHVPGGSPFRFFVTHLEEDLAPPIQIAQAQELLGIVAGERRPVVLVGDFNSAADGSQTETYGDILGAGYVDIWARARPFSPGYTCCRPASLLLDGPLTHRIDFVFVDGLRRHGAVGATSAQRVGAEASDETASGLWPSDHAGVVASFSIAPR